MDLVKNTTPARTSLHAEEAFDLESGELLKIMTPGDPPVSRLEVGPPEGERWKFVVTINGTVEDA